MKDLKEMMRGENNLLECEELIKAEMVSISNEENVLKRAVLLLFFAENAMNQLKGIDSNLFVEKLREKVEEVKQEYDALEKGLRQHIDQNGKVLKDIESVSISGSVMTKTGTDIQELVKKARLLLDQSDVTLKEIIIKRDKLNLEDVVSRQVEKE